MEKISDNLTVAEATKSEAAIRHGIDNTPDAGALLRMKLVAEEVFEPVRAGLGDFPIYVSSFYRSARVNEIIGGSPTSQHVKAEAIDMDGDVFQIPSNRDIFAYIYNNLTFDQLIWEYGTDENPAWVHASYTANHNRNQVLRAVAGQGYIKLPHEEIQKLIS